VHHHAPDGKDVVFAGGLRVSGLCPTAGSDRKQIFPATTGRGDTLSRERLVGLQAGLG